MASTLARGRTLVVVVAGLVALGVPVGLLHLGTGPSAERSTPAVLRSDGSVDPAAYRELAGSLATPTGIEYRFGQPAAGAQAATTASQPDAKPFRGHGVSTDRTYQIGGPQDAARDDYSSDQAQVGYISGSSKDGVGLDHIETLAMSENTFSDAPRLSWTYYGGGHPDPDLLSDSMSGRCLAGLHAGAGRFVAQARAYSYGEETANSLVVLDNGVVVGAGTNTARGGTCTRLPAHLHPSAISVTNGNEFALVTAWNDDTLRSELVVIALGGEQPAGTFWGYDWSKLYPGIRNYGRPTFAKILGSIPLPVAAATGVSAVADVASPQLALPQGGRGLLGDLTLSNETNRRSFISGWNRASIATTGYALVSSREERKVVFVDLQPLFQKIGREYFGSRARFDEITKDIGLSPRQWPQAFSVRPEEQPVVVKTVALSEAPTAVAGLLSGAATPRAYVATADGRLLVYSVSGLATTAAVEPDDIEQAGSISVGPNPTSITYVKDRGTGVSDPQTPDNTLIVTSRGSRAVQWVRMSGNTGRIVRTLQDSRIVDPISTEDNNNHGTESYVVSIADFGGSQVLNYRYGPVVFHTNGGARYGMGSNGRAEFEFGGAYRPGGRPFSISITNVT